MTPLNQVFSQHSILVGDCLRTCVAMLIDATHPTAVPHVMAQLQNDHREGRPPLPNPAQDAISRLRLWLRQYDLDLAELEDIDGLPEGEYAIGIYRTTGVNSHAVIIDHRGWVVQNPVEPIGHNPYPQSDWLSFLIIAEPYDPEPHTLIDLLCIHGQVETELYHVPDGTAGARYAKNRR